MCSFVFSDQNPSFIIPLRDLQYTFLVGLDRDLVIMNWDYSAPNLNGTYTYFTCLLLTVQALCQGNRWRTGRVDGSGNLWAGEIPILDQSLEDFLYGSKKSKITNDTTATK